MCIYVYTYTGVPLVYGAIRAIPGVQTSWKDQIPLSLVDGLVSEGDIPSSHRSFEVRVPHMFRRWFRDTGESFGARSSCGMAQHGLQPVAAGRRGGY